MRQYSFNTQQGQFVDEFWDKAQNLSGVTVTELPGKHAATPGQNRLVLNRVDLSEFDRLPHGEQVLERVGVYPHTLVRIGQTGLFAVFSLAQRSTSLEVIAPLSFEGKPRFTYAIDRLASLAIGQAKAAELYGTRPDLTISPEHIVIYDSQPYSVIEDQGSAFGTEVITAEDKDDGQWTVSNFVPEDWQHDLLVSR